MAGTGDGIDGMIEAVRRICELQTLYAPENTPAMQERGRLIRRVLAPELGELEPLLAPALGEHGHDFEVSASDGIGRKTEAPWVRFASREMSPTPRHGFYAVMHFSADGTSFWVTVGSAGTVWDGRELRALGNDELARRTNWIREVVVARFGAAAPFDDNIDLRARAALPRTFERATALAQRFDPGTATEDDVIASLVAAAERLREVYRAQRVGSHMTPAEAAEAEIEELASPVRRAASGQGMRLSSEERRAIELRAMQVALQHLEQLGYDVKDRSLTAPFDLEAAKDGETVKVEVKGTTAPRADELFMTRNEVELHRREAGRTALITVADIQLERTVSGVTATGGDVECMIGWAIADWEAIPIAYKLKRVN